MPWMVRGLFIFSILQNNYLFLFVFCLGGRPRHQLCAGCERRVWGSRCGTYKNMNMKLLEEMDEEVRDSSD